MGKRGRQGGLGMLSGLVVLLLAAFFLVLGFRLVPVYLEYWSVRQVLHQIAAEPEVAQMNQAQLRAHIQRRFDVNRIDILSARDVQLVRERDQRALDARYETRVPFLFNIDLVVRFDQLLLPLPQS